MKSNAERPTSAQHSGIGIDSITSLARAGSMKMGAVFLNGSGAVMSGCVFDIFTVGAAAFGSCIVAMRAVSFFGLDDGGGAGAGGGTAGETAVFCAASAGGGECGTAGATIGSEMEGECRGEGTGSAIEGTGNDGAFGG